MLAGSQRVKETLRQPLAELRLAFHVMSGQREFHEPYLDDTQAVADLLAAGDRAASDRTASDCAATEQRLSRSFDTAEAQLIRVLRRSAQLSVSRSSGGGRRRSARAADSATRYGS